MFGRKGGTKKRKVRDTIPQIRAYRFTEIEKAQEDYNKFMAENYQNIEHFSFVLHNDILVLSYHEYLTTSDPK